MEILLPLYRLAPQATGQWTEHCVRLALRGGPDAALTHICFLGAARARPALPPDIWVSLEGRGPVSAEARHRRVWARTLSLSRAIYTARKISRLLIPPPHTSTSAPSHPLTEGLPRRRPAPSLEGLYAFPTPQLPRRTAGMEPAASLAGSIPTAAPQPCRAQPAFRRGHRSTSYWRP